MQRLQDIIRRLQRYIAREIYRDIINALTPAAA
jgi:hypothetical protein